MAEIITTQKLIDADIDVDNLGKAANELGTVKVSRTLSVLMWRTSSPPSTGFFRMRNRLIVSNPFVKALYRDQW